MAIISESNNKVYRGYTSSQFRYATIYVVITFVVLLVLNFYCSNASKSLFYQGKEAAMKETFKVKCPGLEFSLSGVQNKVQQFHQKNGITAETAAYALRCVAGAVFQATKNALKEYPGLRVVFSGGVASNSMLREVIAPLEPIFSQPQFSTDNAMGVAVLTHRYTQE